MKPIFVTERTEARAEVTDSAAMFCALRFELSDLCDHLTYA